MEIRFLSLFPTPVKPRVQAPIVITVNITIVTSTGDFGRGFFEILNHWLRWCFFFSFIKIFNEQRLRIH